MTRRVALLSLGLGPVRSVALRLLRLGLGCRVSMSRVSKYITTLTCADSCIRTRNTVRVMPHASDDASCVLRHGQRQGSRQGSVNSLRLSRLC